MSCRIGPEFKNPRNVRNVPALHTHTHTHSIVLLEKGLPRNDSCHHPIVIFRERSRCPCVCTAVTSRSFTPEIRVYLTKKRPTQLGSWSANEAKHASGSDRDAGIKPQERQERSWSPHTQRFTPPKRTNTNTSCIHDKKKEVNNTSNRS